MFPNPIFNICIYKQDMILNNQQGLICYKTKPNQTKYSSRFVLNSLNSDLFKDLSAGQKWFFHYNSLYFIFILWKQILKAFSFASISQLYLQQPSLSFDDLYTASLISSKWIFPYSVTSLFSVFHQLLDPSLYLYFNMMFKKI